MNFHQLIRQREVLLQQARLANMAYAYHHLCAHAERIANARLQGLV
jgi:recombinational DNA repair ATPase RecF